MKKTVIFLSLVLLLTTFAWCDTMDGSVTLKYTGFDNQDSPVKASEYRDDNADVGADILLKGIVGTNGLFLFSGHRITGDDQRYDFTYWTDRHFKMTGSYNEFVHQLVRDPMTNLEAAGSPKAVWHTDYNPGSRNGIVYSNANYRLDYAVHGYENLKFFAAYRNQERHGTRQARTLSKCASCHIVGMDRRVDESTQDVKAGASWSVGNFRLMASHLTRRYAEDGPTPMNTYDLAEHPALHVPVFYDRVQYDILDGPLPFNQVPDVKKDQDQVRMDYTWTTGDITGAYTTAKITNETTENDYDYDAWYINTNQKLGKKASLRVKFRTYDLDNDDVFVDVREQASIAGPWAGQTWQDYTGHDPDFLRQSALNRSVNDGIVELKYRYARHGHLKFGYRYLSEDRDTYEVAAGETDTQTNKLYIDWRTWMPKSWKLNAHMEYSDISHPFANVDGGCSAYMTDEPSSSPLAPGAIQYWDIQDSRTFDLSNQPSKEWMFRFNASKPLSPKTHLMFNFNYTDDKNDDLDHSTWDGDNLMGSIYFNFMPSSTWTWFAGYTYQKQTSSTHVCIPVFDG